MATIFSCCSLFFLKSLIILTMLSDKSSRILFCVPPPHGAEHLDQSLQAVSGGLTGGVTGVTGVTEECYRRNGHTSVSNALQCAAKTHTQKQHQNDIKTTSKRHEINLPMTGVAEGDGAKSPGVVVGSNGGSGSTRSASLSETTASLTSFSKMTGGNGKITSSERNSF